MSTTEQPVPPPVLSAIMDPRLRGFHADRVFAVLWPSLDDHEANVVKVNQTALSLGIDRRQVRHALTVLVATGFLVFSHRDENKRAYYWLGERGAARPPVPS